MTAAGGSGAAVEHAGSRTGRALRGLALSLVLFCLLGRCFLNELPFRTSALLGVYARQAEGESSALGYDHGELARLSFAMLLLAPGSSGCWAGRLRAACGCVFVGWPG